MTRIGRMGLIFADMTEQHSSLQHENLTHSIVGCFFDVYNELGYGFLESVYAAAMEIALREKGHSVRREVAVPVYFRGRKITRQRLDMIVEETIVLELKSTEKVPTASREQLQSYLRATDLEVGLLFHFGLKPQFERLVFSNTRKKRNPRRSAPSAQSA